MKFRKVHGLLLILALGGVLFLTACDTPTRHRVLTTFFDGVPPLNSGTNATPVAVVTTEPDQLAVAPKTNAPPVDTFSVHQPFGEHSCTECHQSSSGMGLKSAPPKLCWDCHDNFLEKAKFQHDVVEDCNSCHNPHQSPEKKLLVKNLLALCGDCHDDKDLKAVKGHAGAEGRSCTDCHDPHVGADKNLLKTAAKTK